MRRNYGTVAPVAAFKGAAALAAGRGLAQLPERAKATAAAEYRELVGFLLFLVLVIAITFAVVWSLREPTGSASAPVVAPPVRPSQE